MAALATLLITALLLIPAGSIQPDGFLSGGGSGSAPDQQPVLSAPAGQGQWPEDPLAFPKVQLPPAR